MLKPACKIEIGAATFDSSVDQRIISASIDLDIDLFSDSFQVVLTPCTRASAIKIGDPVVIELGYEGAFSKVLTGSVDDLEFKISQVTVKGLCSTTLLTRLRINQVYQKQAAGAIVKDLAGKVGIPIKSVEDGLNFPVYYVDDSKDAYTHMKELAMKCGFDLYMNEDGKLVFKKYSRRPAKQFKYGVNIMEAEVHERMPLAACLKVLGESPSSSKGADTAHWISKRAVVGVAGDGSPLVVEEDPTVRDKDTADKVAAALLQSMSYTLSGTLKVLGNAGISLGDTIEFSDMPDSRMNGEFEARCVSHSFSKKDGFVSAIGWRKWG